MKNILFLVTGTSPAIVTETVYGLVVNPTDGYEKWIPSEIKVLSTKRGINLLKERLFDEGNFAKLCTEYELPPIKFDENSFIIIKDDNNNLQEDIRTPKDNEKTANLICQTIKQITDDENTSLHVSIAGGRKTMGFYAGYALSLYGREQDSMSHVLVEADFDETAVPNFYYPTKNDHFVLDRSGQEHNAKNAKIWLSRIPFVRLRSYIPQKSLLTQASFVEVVNAINMASQPLHVVINEIDKTVSVADKVCRLAPREFAYYLWLAKRKQLGQGGVSRPIEGVPYDEAQGFKEIYANLGKARKVDFDQDYFDQRNTYLKRDLSKIFGLDVAQKIGIEQLENGLYECVLSPEQITIDEF